MSFSIGTITRLAPSPVSTNVIRPLAEPTLDFYCSAYRSKRNAIAFAEQLAGFSSES